ncbi:SusC/RagA family TonB-linked outer membrane protein [Niabella insulamsoli]|uniref:SusC/RagA family TonB-linked outer membrane protein n=1 Tax=Niabella insulamsoli TaxID=3144874 RepID=UPI0031FDC8C1
MAPLFTLLKLRKKMLLTATLVLACLISVAQQRTITGTVVNAESKQPLPNISIQVENSLRGTISSSNGRFSIQASTGETLTFSGVGFAMKQVILSSESSLNIELVQGVGEMDEVVVTALGIKRESRSLGYSQTTLENEDLTNAISGNWTDALSGKVAGLNMIRSGAGPTGSNKIILRGENNLTGENEALIVVDGVVINNGSARRTANGSEAIYGTGSDNMPADYGSGLNDINPEDIESVTVLKGPGAAALYGQRGANGAIIITTKSAKRKDKKWGITFNSNVSTESVNRWPDMQFEYGQGLRGDNYYSFGAGPDGGSTSATSSAYGPKFNGQMFYQYNPDSMAQGLERTPWVPYTNKLRNYFETGKTLTNSITADKNFGKTNIRLSYTNVNNNWIMPNTGYGRNTASFTINSKPIDKLQLSAKINYTNKQSDNLPGAGYGNQSVMYWFIFWQPNADLDWLKEYWHRRDADGNPIQPGNRIFYPYSTFPENPYAIAYEFLNESNRNTLIGNVSATYSFNKDLSLMVRTSGDYGNEDRAQKRPYDAGSRFQKGSYRTQDIKAQEWTTDFLLKYNKELSSNWSITATAGGSHLKNSYDRLEKRADSLNAPFAYDFNAALGNPVTIPYRSEYVINSFYGLFSAAFKNYLYVDLSGRQDWNSVLATPSRTSSSGFFYPALNMSYILSDAYHLPDLFNFAKLRFSLSSVGSGTTIPYRTSYNYVRDFLFDSAYYQNPTVLANPDLKPLRTTTAELGANFRMFKNRLTIDVAGYIGNTKNQILERILDRSSGYTREVINAGKVRNTGFELAINANTIRSKVKGGFEWSTDIVYATNRNRVVSMPDSSLVIGLGPVGGGQIVAKVGGSMGDLYGRGYQRAPDGQVIYDANTGWAKLATDVVYLGNTIPKGKIGLGNQFSYKGVRLTLRFDAQWGAVAHSLMHYKMAEQGKLSSTLPGRYSGIIGNGVVQNSDGTYRTNDVIATDIDQYYRSHWGIDNAEGSTFSTDFIKFREARLDYNLPQHVVGKIGLNRVTVGVFGRDLFIWSSWPMFDPEFGTLSGTDIVRGFEVAQFPSTRTIGANLVIGL